MKHTRSSPPRLKFDIQPAARELRWFAHIDRHGPQSSEFLYELTRDTHRCRDTALRRLQVLREAGYLRLPPQQRQIAKADFNPYVYDLSRLGWDILAGYKDLERHCRPTGHWWHGYWVSAVSGAIEISAVRAGHTYIPAAQILAIKGVELGIPLSGGKLIPDQLFAIKYPDGYRAFALEVDRGTEPVRSSVVRKSLRRSVEQYQYALEKRVHQRHFGLKSNMAVLWVFNSGARQRQFGDLVRKDDRRFAMCHIHCEVPKWCEFEQLSSLLRVM